MMTNSTSGGLLGTCLSSATPPTDPASICVATMLVFFGAVYLLFGYKCFKAVMFLTGFIFASFLVYLICIQEKLLPTYANAGIALCAGLLFGLITMLVQYVGLFMTGFHTGLLLALATRTFIHHFYQPQSLLVSIVALLGSGLLFAILNLQWHRSTHLHRYLRRKRRVQSEWVKHWTSRKTEGRKCSMIGTELRLEDPNSFWNFMQMSAEKLEQLLSFVELRIKK